MGYEQLLIGNLLDTEQDPRFHPGDELLYFSTCFNGLAYLYILNSFGRSNYKNRSVTGNLAE